MVLNSSIITKIHNKIEANSLMMGLKLAKIHGIPRKQWRKLLKSIMKNSRNFYRKRIAWITWARQW
jgi:uncharacterized protein VirK/YbjX